MSKVSNLACCFLLAPFLPEVMVLPLNVKGKYCLSIRGLVASQPGEKKANTEHVNPPAPEALLTTSLICGRTACWRASWSCPSGIQAGAI